MRQYISNEDLIKIGLSLISITITLLFIEVALTQYGLPRRTLQQQAATKVGLPYDTRTRWEVVADLNRTEEKFVASILPSLYWINEFEAGRLTELTRLPLAGMPDTLTVCCNELGVYKTFVSDQHGFNNAATLYNSPIDIAIIGDSFALGHAVPTEAEIATHLRLARSDNIVNFAYSGSGPLAQLGILKEYAAHYHPPLVLWFYFEGNDTIDLQREAQLPLLQSYLDNNDTTQNLIEHTAEIKQMQRNLLTAELNKRKIKAMNNAQLTTKLWQTVKLTTIRQLLKQTRTILNEPEQKRCIQPDEATFTLFTQVMTEATQTVTAWQGEIIFVYLPSYYRYQDNSCNYIYQQETILAIMNDLDVETIDVANIVDHHPDPLTIFPFQLFGHYNEDGYELVAKTVINHLELRE